MSSLITNQEKLFWKKEHITKGDVAEYYHLVASYILPYLKDRPQSLKRYPNGIDEPFFFQKNLKAHPDWVKTEKITHKDKTVEYLLIPNEKTLLYAVNLGCIEMHPWFSRIQTLENPDFLIFDLDPEDISFDEVIKTAQVLHRVLDDLHIPNYCKTSGKRGIHIGVPLKAKYSYEIAKQFALYVATLVHEMLPKITSLERSPSKRQKRVYIDCFQNNFGQTLASPFSVRAERGAPVSMPLEWKEVKKGMDPSQFTLFNALDYIKKHGDPFKGVLGKGVKLEKVFKKGSKS